MDERLLSRCRDLEARTGLTPCWPVFFTVCFPCALLTERGLRWVDTRDRGLLAYLFLQFFSYLLTRCAVKTDKNKKTDSL